MSWLWLWEGDADWVSLFRVIIYLAVTGVWSGIGDIPVRVAAGLWTAWSATDWMVLVLLCSVCHAETFPEKSSILRPAFRRLYRLVRCVSLRVLAASISLKCDELNYVTWVHLFCYLCLRRLLCAEALSSRVVRARFCESVCLWVRFYLHISWMHGQEVVILTTRSTWVQDSRSGSDGHRTLLNSGTTERISTKTFTNTSYSRATTD